MNGLIGKKVGMTQVFDSNGVVVPVTVLLAGPCVAVQRKTLAKDGYDAVQLGLVEGAVSKNITKPLKGHFSKTGKGIPPTRILREFPVDLSKDSDIDVGAKVLVDIFSDVKYVNVIANSKGRGFAGVVKRHGFGGGRATHGSMFHRAPGSIGASAWPSRVFAGSRMAGHMGTNRVKVKSLRIVSIDVEKGLLVVKGSVPGPNGGYVMITKG